MHSISIQRYAIFLQDFILPSRSIIFNTYNYSMRINLCILFVWLVTSVTGFSQTQRDTITIAEGLSLIPLTENLYLHLSYFESTDFGRVPCNGLIYINGNDAIVCDTPPNDEESAQLLGWMKEKYPDVKIKALI